jgi:hypothetical protein
MESADLGVMGTAHWAVWWTADWGAVGAIAWQHILQKEFQTVRLTVELLLTARVPAVCDCLLTERSPRMRLHGVRCRVSVQAIKCCCCIYEVRWNIAGGLLW